MKLEGKKIIVTGGANGVGRAITEEYLKQGAKVYFVDVNEERGEKQLETLRKRGFREAHFEMLDISDRESTFEVFAEATRQMGGLDVLANLADIYRPDPGATTLESEIDFNLDVNVKGTVFTNQAAYSLMKIEGGGSIINFGSLSALNPHPGSAAYSLSKGAVHSWSRTVAHEWGEDNVRVNCILPAMATEMYETWVAGMTEKEREVHRLTVTDNIPLGHTYGDPERDLAPVMTFFASDDAHFITGQLIPVDGGLASTR